MNVLILIIKSTGPNAYSSIKIKPMNLKKYNS